MELGLEAALVGSGLLALIQLILYEFREELLGFDQRDLYVAVRISLEEELLLDGLRKNSEYLVGFSGETLADEFFLGILVRKSMELLRL